MNKTVCILEIHSQFEQRNAHKSVQFSNFLIHSRGACPQPPPGCAASRSQLRPKGALPSFLYSLFTSHAPKSWRKFITQDRNCTEWIKPFLYFGNSFTDRCSPWWVCMGFVFHTQESWALTLRIYKKYSQVKQYSLIGRVITPYTEVLRTKFRSSKE